MGEAFVMPRFLNSYDNFLTFPEIRQVSILNLNDVNIYGVNILIFSLSFGYQICEDDERILKATSDM